MVLDNRTASLAAVAASITANCQPCLEINIVRAQKCGAETPEVAAAIEIGRKVRAGAASKMDAFAATLNREVAAPEATCSCGS